MSKMIEKMEQYLNESQVAFRVAHSGQISDVKSRKELVDGLIKALNNLSLGDTFTITFSEQKEKDMFKSILRRGI